MYFIVYIILQRDENIGVQVWKDMSHNGCDTVVSLEHGRYMRA